MSRDFGPFPTGCARREALRLARTGLTAIPMWIGEKTWQTIRLSPRTTGAPEMTAADLPPDRPHLAAMLKAFARSAAYFGTRERRELLEYVQIAEDTITAQAGQLTADITVMGEQVRASQDQAAEIDRLKAENARLTQALERTT